MNGQKRDYKWRSRALWLGALAALGALAPTAGAGTVMSNLPAIDSQTYGISIGGAFAVGFTMSQTLNLDNVIVTLYAGPGVTNADVPVDLLAGSGGQPGAVIRQMTTAQTIVDFSLVDYTYTPVTPVTLQAGQTYFVSVAFTGATNFSWGTSTPQQAYTETGASYVNTQAVFDGSIGSPTPKWTNLNSFSDFLYPDLTINAGGTAAPEPGTWILAAAGFAMCLIGKLRRA